MTASVSISHPSTGAMSLVELVRWRALHQPEQHAYTFLVDGEAAEAKLTYGELDLRSRVIAARLQQLGLEGERVLLLYPPGLEYVTAFFGCLYAGVVAVPAYPPMDGRALPRIRAIAQDAEARAVLTTAELLAPLQEWLSAETELSLHALATDIWEARLAEDWAPVGLSSDSLAFLQYTSGSTGRPRGVELTHGNLLHNLGLIHDRFRPTERSRGVIWLPPYHDMGLIGGILQPLYACIPVTLMSPLAFLQRPLRWLEVISREGADISGGPDFAYDLCVRRLRQTPDIQLDLSRWRLAFNGAEPVRLETLERFAKAFGRFGFREDAFYPCYGLAESTLLVTGRPGGSPARKSFDAAALAANRAVPVEGTEKGRVLVGCGQAAGEQRLLIVGPTTGRRCAPGEVGEVWVSGPSVARGYWNRPEETERSFNARLADGDPTPFLRTGDLGFLDGTELYVTGRLKDLIIIRGRNLYPQDIERTVERCHPALRPGCGAAFSVDASGQERLVVVQELAADMLGEGETPEGLVARLREDVTAQHGVGVWSIVLVQRGTIPKTSSGKIQRHACREGFLRGELSEQVRSLLEEDAGGSRARPREELLEKPARERAASLRTYLEGLIARALRLPQEGPAPSNTLGLDSLAAVELRNQLEAELGVDVSPVVLLRGIETEALAAELARRLEQKAGTPPGAADARLAETKPSAGPGGLPLSRHQLRLWWLEQLEPGTARYQLHLALRLEGDLQAHLLVRALELLVERHEALRATFSTEHGQPVQHVRPAARMPLPLSDISGLPASRRGEEAARLFQEEARRPLDVERGPLLRARLIQLDSREHQLLLTVHHLVADGLSLEILVRELVASYEALVRGRTPGLPPLPVSYAEALRLIDAHAEPSAAELSWWEERLANLPETPLFPRGRSQAHPRSRELATHRFSLPASLAGAIRTWSTQQGVTPFMVLAAGFLATLERLTSREDLVVGVPLQGRRHSALVPQVGFFASPLVLRTQLSGNPSFAELVHRVRAGLLDGWARQDVPLNRLIELARVDRGAPWHPLFQVMFSVIDRSFDAITLPGLVVSPLDVGRGTADVDLFLTMFQEREGLTGVFSFAPELVDAETVAGLASLLPELLAGCLRKPETRLSELVRPPGAVTLAPGDLAAGALEARVQPAVCRIAVASTFTAEPVAAPLRFWLKQLEFPAEVAVAPAEQIFQQLLDPVSMLGGNRGGINVLLLRLEDWLGGRARGEQGREESSAPAVLAEGVEQFARALRAAASRAAVPTLVCVCPPSPEVLRDDGSRHELEQAERSLAESLASIPGVHLSLPGELVSLYPVTDGHEPRAAALGRIPYTQSLFTALGTLIARRIDALRRAPHKVIVLDCDGVLWDGVCGEDGPLGVRLDGARRALQEFMVAQQKAGRLLCLCSRNNEADVVEVFSRRPEMPLTLEHVTAYRINWQAKSANLRALAAELSLGLDSFIFIDDDPVQCAEVRSACPEVLTLQLPTDSERLPRWLAHVWAFDQLRVTDEDRRRAERYREESARKKVQREALTFGEFLESLALRIDIAPMAPAQVERVAQLTQRTNQFNATGRRRSAAEVQQLTGEGNVACHVVEVHDRFGAYGLVGVMISKEEGNALSVDTFLLSCRALGRGVEHRMVAFLGAEALRRGLSTVVVRYSETAKNRPAREFLTSVGEHFRSEVPGGAEYRFPADQAAALVFQPPEAPAPEPAREGGEDAPRSSTASQQGVSAVMTGTRLAVRMAHVATALTSVDDVLRTMQEVRRSRPALDTPYVPPRTEAETVLCRLVAETLGLERVGAHDNFFSLGGDSILAIQVLARAGRAGYHLTPQQLFRSPTVESLAAAAGSLPVIHAEQGAITGPHPLTPIQHWFFELPLAERHHFNQALLLEVGEALSPRHLASALLHLLEHHDALRTRFVAREGVWTADIAPVAAFELEEVDLSGLEPAAQDEALRTSADALQARLHLADGPLVRAALYLRGRGREPLLLLVIHHLVIDGVSWRILVEDLQRACEQLERGESIALPPKTTSFKDWAHRLNEAALGEAGRSWGLTPWSEASEALPPPLPVDLPGANTVATQRTVEVVLHPEETRALLHQVPAAYRTGPNDVLLSALAQAVGRITGASSLWVDLEGHGREPLFEDVDVSRTVGWFTALFPVLLELRERTLPGEVLKSVKEQLRALPLGGLAFGLRRYLGESAERDQLSRLPVPSISFNYLGQLDAGMEAGTRLRLVSAFSDADRGPTGLRAHLIEIIAFVRDGQLHVAWQYSDACHRRSSVEALATAFIECLRVLVSHCLSPEAGGRTPSDFPLVTVEQPILDRLLEASGGPRQVEDLYPLAPVQQGMLFHTIQSPGSGVYLEQWRARLRGPLDARALRAALEGIIERHASLRTAFQWEGLEEPVQIVHQRVELAWQVLDWSDRTPHAQAEAFEALLEGDRREGFEPDAPPLMRVKLVRLREDEHELVWSLHHLLLDAWSGLLVFREFITLYAARCLGTPERLAPVRPYRDYIAWLRARERGTAEAFWREELRGYTNPLTLRLAREEGESRGFGEQSTVLAPGLHQALQAMAQRHGLTMNTVLLGAWALLLGRYGDQRDLVLGLTVSGRPAELPGVESMVGLFVNSLPLRVRLPSSAPLLSWLETLQERQAQLQGYQYTPLVDIQGWSEVPRGTSLFETLFAFEHDLAVTRESLPGGLRVEDVALIDRTHYPLTLIVTPGASFTLRLGYDRAHCSDEAARGLLERLSVLLGAFPGHAGRLSALPILTEAERRQANAMALGPRRAWSGGVHLHTLVSDQAHRTPEAAAVVFEGRTLTYRELERRSNQLARTLRARGIGPELCVGVLMERALELPVALLAILKAGGAYVPLDPEHPSDRLARMRAIARAPVVITQERFEPLARGLGADVVTVDVGWEGLDSRSAEPLGLELDEDALAYVIFTSGSTGEPKGVMNSHRGVCNRLRWGQDAIPLDDGERVLQKTPFTFDVSVWEFFWPLIRGACLVMARPGGHRDSAWLVRFMSEARITTAHFVPSMLRAFLEEPGVEACTTLRRVLCSGEALPYELQERFFSRLDVPLYNLYGPTEAAIEVSAWQCRRGDRERVVPMGWPIANTQLHVLDRELAPLPPGIAGELYIGGVQVARGYAGRADLTAERFIPDPFSENGGGRLYRTGDLVRRRADGALEFLGRLDQQVKIRGFRIEPGEVEAALLGHPGVREAAAVVREEPQGGAGLVAYVVPHAGGPRRVELLREYLALQLPPYMIPSAWVLLDALPLTSSGKLDRRALPPPRTGTSEQEAPRTALEAELARIWAEVLGLERVGRDDRFFDLGGHSLLATRIVSRIRSELRIELPLRAMLEAETLAALAERIAAMGQGGRVDAEPLVPRQAGDGPPPVSFAQQRLWFLHQLEPGQHAYHVVHALRLSGRLDTGAFERGLEEVVRRHETLRTTFRWEGEHVVQVISAAAELPLSCVDLSQWPLEGREAEVRRLASREHRRPFELELGPLFRALLVRLGEEEHVFLLVMHHIISDGWSMGVLVRELAELYGASILGRPAVLPPLTVQYADHAIWQRKKSQSARLERSLEYWRHHLSGELPSLELPLAQPRPPVQGFRGASRTVRWAPEQVRALEAFSHQQGVTPFMTVLSAFASLLFRYTGQTDIIVGTPIANRNRAELEPLIGFFVNTLALRMDLSGEPSFRMLVERVRAVALDAYVHQDVPFERVVEALQPTRDLSRSPIFQVVCAMQNAPLSLEDITHPDGTVLHLDVMPLETETAKFDLALLLEPRDGGLAVTAEYNQDLFEPGTVDRMLGHLQILLAAALAEPGTSVRTLPLLTDAERRQLLLEWNGHQVALPWQGGVLSAVEAQARLRPDTLAVEGSGGRLTYRELEARAEGLARELRGLGIGREAPVAICLERSWALPVAMLGILKAGGAYVPLDPILPRARLETMISACGATVVITEEGLRSRISGSGARLLCLERLAAASPLDSEAAPSRGLVHPESRAYVIYTSGSTGEPKGVEISHEGLANLVAWHHRAYRVTPEDRATLVAGPAFDASTWEIWPYLTAGASLHIVEDAVRDEPAGLVQWLAARRITLSFLPTPLAELVLNESWPGDSSLRALLTGGDKLRRGLAEGQHFELVNHYGPTEDSVVTTCGPVGLSRSEPPPIGRPIDNHEVFLLDGALRPVPVGVPGELCIGGRGLARGYLNRPELTAEKFVPHPFSQVPGARLYRTGDLARFRPDGTIEFLGRLDHQVKIRGFRIEVGEIEARLLQHPDVREAAVLARDEGGSRRLVAYVVPRRQPGPSLAELRPFLEERLAAYMVPAALVVLEALPLTPNGKVDRRALPAPAWSGTEEGGAASSSEVEAALARLWAEVLGLERVRPEDNFFELGGDSILSIQLVSRARAEGLHFTVRQIFQHQTLAQLASVARRASQDEQEQAPRTGELPLTPIQHWFFEGRFELNHFNQAVLLELRESPDPVLLEQALRRLMEHHDALRLRFERRDDGWHQLATAPGASLALERVDLRGLPEAEVRAAIEEKGGGLQASLRLEEGQLVRCVLFESDAAPRARLLLVIHHLAVDGVSWRILVEDLVSSYARLRRGETPRLPPKSTSFGHWAERLVSFARSGALEAEKDFWLTRGGAGPLPVELPGGRDANTVASAARVQATLGASETQQLLQGALQAYRTRVDELILAAFLQAVGGWTGERALLVNLEAHGRETLFEEVDLSRTVGWFTALYPLRLTLPGSERPDELIVHIKEQLRAVPRHGIGYGLLRYLSGEPELASRLAALQQPEVSFNYLGQFDRWLPPDSPFALSLEPTGPSHGPGGLRPHLLDVSAAVVNGQLLFEWTYSQALHRRETIERVALATLEALRALVAHCLRPEAGGFTASDFPLARLDTQKLNKLSTLLKRSEPT
nr:nonribosomal peptide synthetase [Cystobacter sp.]